MIAVDIPPFGWSSIPKDQDYRKEIQAKRIVSLLNSLSLAKPVIAGHSYNSKVAVQIASLYDIKKLILVAPVLDYKQKEGSGLVGVLASMSILRDPLLSLFVNNTALAKNLLYSFMYKKEVDIDEVLTYTILPFNKMGVNHAYGEWFQEFFSETSAVSDSQTLAEITAPLAVIWGDHDTIAVPTHFQDIQRINKRAELSTIANVGHMPHLEDSDTFNKVILEVLGRN